MFGQAAVADTSTDMPLFRDKREAHVEEEAPPPPPGPQLLFDGPILVSWFVIYRLGQELERARRYGSFLSVLIAEPQLIANERVSDAQSMAAAEAADKSARTTDLVGWLDSQHIIVILPQTDAASARFAATRFRDEIWMLSHVQGNQKWQISLVDDLDEIQALLDQTAATLAA
jgi:hypothetical protein